MEEGEEEEEGAAEDRNRRMCRRVNQCYVQFEVINFHYRVLACVNSIIDRAKKFRYTRPK